MVGVKKLWCRDSKETETPSPPDAPWGWPTIDLVELTGILVDRNFLKEFWYFYKLGSWTLTGWMCNIWFLKKSKVSREGRGLLRGPFWAVLGRISSWSAQDCEKSRFRKLRNAYFSTPKRHNKRVFILYFSFSVLSGAPKACKTILDCLHPIPKFHIGFSSNFIRWRDCKRSWAVVMAWLAVFSHDFTLCLKVHCVTFDGAPVVDGCFWKNIFTS